MSDIETFDVDAVEKVEKMEPIIIDEVSTELSVFKITEQPLTMDLTLSLHTATGQGLFGGEWSPGKMGLREFGRCIQILCEASEHQDPYAQWQLLKIFEALQSLKATLQEQEKRLNKQIRSLRGIQLKAFRNTNPFTVSLTSINSFVLWAANLITQIDYLTRLLLTIKQLGLVPVMPLRIQTLCEEIQKIFVLSEMWEKTEITRQEILDKTKKAQKLEKQWGKIPEGILHQTTVLPFLMMEV